MKRCIAPIAMTVSVIIAGSLIIGCIFRDLKKEIADYDTSFALVGRVIDPSERQGQVIVILFTEDNGKQAPVRYIFPDEDGNFSFLVEEGNYYLGAFKDTNENLRHDPGEYAGYFGSPDKIVTPVKRPVTTVDKTIQNLNIRLSPDDTFTDGMDMTADLDIQQMPVFKIGEIKRLEDSVFDPANGITGYWKPLTFIKQFGIGIYFLEPYDPERIPVLFVHGATGTPLGWKEMASHLDNNFFQPWFFYYPSGIRLNASANTMRGLFQVLHDKYRFKRLYVIAHSMGGLVSRAAILANHYQDGHDYINLFISLSTPWGGIRMAQKGVEKAPGVIPSWKDVVPNSDFLNEIYNLSLSPDIPSYLFFSHKGDCSLFMENNDGTVELESELDYRAQSDAVGIYGFYEDHGSILESPTVLERLQMVLKNARGK